MYVYNRVTGRLLGGGSHSSHCEPIGDLNASRAGTQLTKRSRKGGWPRGKGWVILGVGRVIICMVSPKGVGGGGWRDAGVW
jgi:hypothetical protein